MGKQRLMQLRSGNHDQTGRSVACGQRDRVRVISSKADGLGFGESSPAGIDASFKGDQNAAPSGRDAQIEPSRSIKLHLLDGMSSRA